MKIIVIPDTQNLARVYYTKMVDFIIVEQPDLVMHVGDIVNNATEAEWLKVTSELPRIWDAGIPFVTAMGNHDYDTGNPNSDWSNNVTYNANFGTGQTKLTSKSWFKGFSPAGTGDNYYAELTVGGKDYLIISLEFGARDAAMDWCDDLIASHPNHEVLVVTHSYMWMDGTRTGPDDDAAPTRYRMGSKANNGEDMWEKVFSKYSNILGIHSGHHIRVSEQSIRTDLVGTRRVLQAFHNWQQFSLGGEGRCVIVDIDFAKNRQTGTVYNPNKQQYETQYNFSEVIDASISSAVSAVTDDFTFLIRKNKRTGTYIKTEDTYIKTEDGWKMVDQVSITKLM